MTTFEKVTQDITCYKPRMHAAKDLKDIPLSFNRNTTCQVKADGEFNYIKYVREGETFALNRFGRKTVDLPALKELAELMKQWNIVEAEMLGEFYTVDEQGKPLTLPKLIHYLKGSDTRLQQYVKIGLFELVSLNGTKSELIYPLKFQAMQSWVQGGSLVHVLDWIEPANFGDLQRYWKGLCLQIRSG